MATKQADSFRESPEYQKGHSGELLIANLLRERGWYVVPSYDYTGRDDNKAPKLQGQRIAYVLPDLDISKEGKRIWAEVKTKEKPDFTRITGRYEHGMQTRHWRDYQEVQRITGCPVWVFVFEQSSGEILHQSIDNLQKSFRLYEGKKMGNGGMVFFPRDSFVVFHKTKEQANGK